MIFAIFRVPMVLQVVGKCLNLRDFSWRSFRYAILATKGPGKVIRVIFPSQQKCQSEPFFCVPMVLQVVGKCLNLRNFSWRSFWYAILATRGLWKTSEVKNLPSPSSNGVKSPPFWWFFAISRTSRPPTWAYGASLKSLVHGPQPELLFGSSCYTKNCLREQNVKDV